ncbi:MAG: glycosyltransferase, partial [Candidatus Bathyarchaeia archaeon]
STKGTGIPAYRIRINYFKRALEAEGYNLMEFEIDLSGIKKYLSYLFRSPAKSLIDMSKNADIIITSVPPILNAITSYKIAREHNLPLIVDIRDIWEEYAKTEHSILHSVGIVQKIIREYYEALKYSSKITVVTEPMKRYYEEKLNVANKLAIISNGTDANLIKPSKEIKRDIDLIYLADLNQPYHNLEFLFEAMKEENLTLIIVGGGKYLPILKNTASDLKISDRVSFAGWVPYENLSQYLCKAKVGVVGRPFIKNIEYLYTIPVKVYDYLAAGLPIAGYGSTDSFLEEFIRKNDVGIYVDQEDPAILASSLATLVNEYDKYVERARALAMKFDRKELSKKLVEVVNNILG